MDIGVLVKASLDVNLIRSDAEGNLLVGAVPLAISEYDRNAVAEAVRIKRELGGRIYIFSALTWGPIVKRSKEIENVMREALAMGGDEAHTIIDENIVPSDLSLTPEVLSKLILKVSKCELILTGESSMDMMSSQLPIRLGNMLGYSVVTFARKIEIKDGKVIVTRDLEDNLEVVEAPLPAVISVTGEINRPRLPTLLQIRRSFSKPFTKYNLSDLGVVVKDKLVYDELKIVTISRKNVVIEGDNMDDTATKLIDKLIEEGVIKV